MMFGHGMWMGIGIDMTLTARGETMLQITGSPQQTLFLIGMWDNVTRINPSLARAGLILTKVQHVTCIVWSRKPN